MYFSEEYPPIYKKWLEAQTVQEILQMLRAHSDDLEDPYDGGFDIKKGKKHA